LDVGNDGVLATGAAVEAVGAAAPKANDVDLAGAGDAALLPPPPNLNMSVEADDV